jgi:hypothetical protein
VQLVDGLDESNRLRLQVLERFSPAPLKLRSVTPAAIVFGKPFNVQESGASALSVACEGAGSETTVVLGDSVLVTTYGRTNWLTALVPAEFLVQPGRYPVQLRDGDRTSNELVFTVGSADSSSGDEGT